VFVYVEYKVLAQKWHVISFKEIKWLLQILFSNVSQKPNSTYDIWISFPFGSSRCCMTSNEGLAIVWYKQALIDGQVANASDIW
jgi:hypothetical protein